MISLLCVVCKNPFTVENAYGITRNRYLMEQKIGRQLLQNEIVHHIDHHRLNNNINNLQLMTTEEHSSYHSKARVPIYR